MAGTTLVASQAEVLVQDGKCSIDGIQDNETFNGLPFERTLWADTSGENIRQTLGFQTARNERCYRLILFRQSCDPGKTCDSNHQQPFSPGPEVHAFKQMVGTLQFL